MKKLAVRLSAVTLLAIILAGSMAAALTLLAGGVAVAGISVGRKKPTTGNALYNGLQSGNDTEIAVAIEEARQEGWEVTVVQREG